MLTGSEFIDSRPAHAWYNKYHLDEECRYWFEMSDAEKFFWVSEYRLWREKNEVREH